MTQQTLPATCCTLLYLGSLLNPVKTQSPRLKLLSTQTGAQHRSISQAACAPLTRAFTTSTGASSPNAAPKLLITAVALPLTWPMTPSTPAAPASFASTSCRGWMIQSRASTGTPRAACNNEKTGGVINPQHVEGKRFQWGIARAVPPAGTEERPRYVCEGKPVKSAEKA